ncbi:DNA repair protein RecO [Oceanospirillum beijerinckii]|uniref:DNA repair protein RecO n=1 Tax=Oceanospirillum beijerinckii TaxID=64976 RepID=UPI0003F692E9|nr:DNA repair protein RecO [Oceanospirillum beijerinckii]
MMSVRVECQPAYVLHTRPYKETSALVSLLTLDYGRIDGVARGVRQKKSRNRALLQPLQPLHISWRGDSSLKSLFDIEACGALPLLNGRALSCVLYANELLTRLLLVEEPDPELFREYALLLVQLQQKEQLEPALRSFEWQLLQTLGYPILYREYSGGPLQQDRLYRYHWQSGFHPVAVGQQGLLGKSLLAMQQGDWLDELGLKTAKQLNRMALQPLLGDKPLLSRQLFRSQAPSEMTAGVTGAS